jgi:hypothetical protein
MQRGKTGVKKQCESVGKGKRHHETKTVICCWALHVIRNGFVQIEIEMVWGATSVMLLPCGTF